MARRHLLIFASQCRSMPRLDRLKTAADALVDVLSSSVLGCCEPGLPDDRSLLHGNLTKAEIENAAKKAIEYASEESATLVLVFLGHGFTPGESSTLYFMCGDSTHGNRLGAIEVGALLRDAADTLGVNGVIGIIDTCHAAGAQPASQELARGLRGGQTRLSLVMAASVTEPAFDLELSRRLAALLRQGINDTGPVLRAGDVVPILRSQIRGQTIVGSDYDGGPSNEAALWLARNRRHATGAFEGLLGPLGRAELTTALQDLDPSHSALLEPWNSQTLHTLRSQLATPDGSSRWERARRAAVNAYIAQRTVEFLRSRMGHDVSTSRLGRALTALWASEGRLTPVPQWPTDVEAVDYVAFEYPASHPDCGIWMARFVLLLASGTGLDLEDASLWEWANSISARQWVVDANAFVQDMQKQEHLRLAINLPSLAGDWPESLDAWLLCDGVLREHESFPCRTVDRAGTDEALRDVLAWAHLAAQGCGLELRHVDVAAPTALLLNWHPEQVEVGGEYLGVSHEVVAHWNQRLSPPKTLWWMRKAAADRLQAIGNCTSGVPLDWLDDQETDEPERLQESFKKGRYMRGIGLPKHPGAKTWLMELILPYAPIVVWPREKVRFSAERQSCLDQHWGVLPRGFAIAYRMRWREEDAGDLADLRAVWEDREWLEFCAKLAYGPIDESRNS